MQMALTVLNSKDSKLPSCCPGIVKDSSVVPVAVC
jgi:hypothetical protein